MPQPARNTQHVVVVGWMKRLERMAGDMDVCIDAESGSGGELRGAYTHKVNIDMTGWTAYELGRHKAGELMLVIREDIKRLDEIEATIREKKVAGTPQPPQPGTCSDTARRVAVTNRIRMNIRTLKADTTALKRCAGEEGRLDEYKELLKHMRRTERMHTDRMVRDRAVLAAEGEGSFGDVRGDDFDSAVPVPVLKELEVAGDGMLARGRAYTLEDTLLDPAADEEFAVFFAQTRERDERIEEGLVRLNDGLDKLKEHAITIQDEVQTQNAMLDATGEKAERVSRRLEHLNTRMTRTLKEVGKDRVCCYAVCFLILLGVVGVLVVQFQLLSDKDE